MNPLVSIIVPVYKVEKYIDRCVASLTEQTYPNLEIILVDDGSPDNCPAMCDEWAKKDARIKVLHQKNGGASAARNAGLDICKGEYLTFVDSDDYIEKDLVEVCLDKCLKDGAEVVIYRLENVFKDHTKLQHIDEEYYKDADSILQGIFWDDVPSYPVRFFKASLWKKVRFPLNTNWEDLVVMPDIFVQVKNAVYIERPLYHYECGNAASTSSSIKSKNKFGMYWGWRKRKVIGENLHNESLRKFAIKRSLRSAITCLGLNTQDKLLLPEQVAELNQYIEQEYNKPGVPNIGGKYKFLIWSLFNCPSMLSAYGWIMYALQRLKNK